MVISYHVLVIETLNPEIPTVSAVSTPEKPCCCGIHRNHLIYMFFTVVVGFMVLAGVAYGAFWYGQQNALLSTPQPSSTLNKVTPISSDSAKQDQTSETAGWKTYTASESQFSFIYPADWVINKNDPTLGPPSFTYTVGGTDYKMIISYGGRGGPEADSIVSDQMEINGKKFIKRSWIKNNIPFFISFMIDEEGFNLFNNIEIYLPVQDNSKYVEIFDQIIRSLKFN